MKLVVLSDIHSHAKALRYWVERFRDDPEIKFCFLGDVIGYGVDPVGCLKILKGLEDQGKIYSWYDTNNRRKIAVIGGNHEAAWLWCENSQYREIPQKLTESKDRLSRRSEAIKFVNSGVASSFNKPRNYEMRTMPFVALLLNMASLEENSDPAIGWYRSVVQENGYGVLPVPCMGYGEQWTLFLAHGSCEYPEHGEIFPCKQFKSAQEYTARQRKKIGDRSILLHGHTHVPLYFDTERRDRPDLIYDNPIPQESGLVVINPGSVGLPRDGDRRTSAALLEFDGAGLTTTFLRGAPNEDVDHLHEEHLNRLEEEKYPSDIREWIKNASINKLEEACVDLLRNRAGSFWMPIR